MIAFVVFTRLICQVIKHFKGMKESICGDFRFFILFMCFYSSFYTFCQMGIIKFELRPLTNFGIELNQSIIILTLSLYYINRASSIISNGKRFYRIVSIWTLVSCGIYFGIGIKGFIHYTAEKKNLCTL